MTRPAPLAGGRAAFTFLTVIPVGGFPFPDAAWRWAAAWFPFVGAFLGTAAAGAFILLRPAGLEIAAVAAVTLTILLTGAFHEDGLADSADAVGGAFNREKLFEILKDSRVGTYGAVALAISVLLRASCLVALDEAAPLALILVHTLARTSPVWMMATVPYVTSSNVSKSRPVVGAGWMQVAGATLFSAALLLLFVLREALPVYSAGWMVVAVLAVAVVCSRYYLSRAGGLTGDFLGATEQINEMVLLILLAYTNAV